MKNFEGTIEVISLCWWARHMRYRHNTHRLWLTALISFVCPAVCADTSVHSLHSLYAVNESSNNRGSISVYDIDAGHRLIRTIQTILGVDDIRGVTGNALTGRLYVAYRNSEGIGSVYCLNLNTDTIIWNRAIHPGVDRLAMNPNGRSLYVPTWEGGTANYINVLDASTGDITRRVYFSNRSHDTQFPLSGPIFQETKADDGSGNFLYMIDPNTFTVSRVGPYLGILGPYAIDNSSTYVVNNVTSLWGMQVANVRTGEIVTAKILDHPPGNVGLLHGIGWTPDEREVWESGPGTDPHVYVWDMITPMAPVLKETLTLRSGRGSHWLTFDIKGDYGYVAPEKNSDDGTEIFNVRTHATVGVIAASEDMLEVDFENGKVSRVGDQYGIGRR
jgi:WD40 repeat protein